MAKVSNEVRLIVRLWKEKLEKRRDFLKAPHLEKEELALREVAGINFAENRLVEIICDLEEGKL